MLNAGDRLGGFVGQSMGGPKSSFVPYSKTFGPDASSYTWTVPRSGFYEVVAWGPGGVYFSGTFASGAFALKTIQLNAGQQITIQVGRGDQLVSGSGTSTSGTSTHSVITFPDGSTMTAQASSGGSAGTASGGDVNVAGVSSSSTTAGQAATGYTTTYNVYVGGGVNGVRGYSPGAGTAQIGSSYGSDGLVIVNRVR